MDILPQYLQKQHLDTIQTTPSTIPSDPPGRQKVQTPSWAAESKATGEKIVRKFSCTKKQTELKGKVSYNPFDSNIELTDDFQNLSHKEFEFTNQENYISLSGKLKQNRSFWNNTINSNDTVLNIIQERYRLPFLETPYKARFTNKVCNN